MLELSDLRAGYGKIDAVCGVSLTVARGEIVAVLGNNGVGKSSLLRAAIGLIRARSGRVSLDGDDVSRLSSHRRVRAGLAYVPQGRGLVPRLTVKENMLVATSGLKNPHRVVDETLALFPALDSRGDMRASELSGGLQQIVAVARSLVRKPKVLLLDEPSEGIAPSVLGEIGEHLLTANKEYGVAILLVEQNLEWATGLADRACFMRRGEIVSEMAAAPAAAIDREAAEREFIEVQLT